MVTLQGLVEGIGQGPCGVVTVWGEMDLVVHEWTSDNRIFLLFILQPTLYSNTYIMSCDHVM